MLGRKKKTTKGYIVLVAVAVVVVLLLSSFALVLNRLQQTEHGAAFASPESFTVNQTWKYAVLKAIDSYQGVVNGLTINPSNKEIYASIGSGVMVINTSSESAVSRDSLDGMGVFPGGIVYDSSNNLLYVISATSPTNLVIADGTTMQVVKKVYLGYQPAYSVYVPANGNIYITNINSGEVAVLNTTTNNIVSNISVGQSPVGIIYVPYNRLIYVAETSSSTVTVINSSTNSVIDNISVGRSPFAFAYNPAAKLLYVTNRGGTNITVVDTATNRPVTSISTANLSPWGIAFDQANELLFVSCHSDNLLLINTTNDSLMANLSAGMYAWQLLYDGFNGHIYGADTYNGSVYVIGIAQPPSKSNPSIRPYYYLLMAASVAVAIVGVAWTYRRRTHKKRK